MNYFVTGATGFIGRHLVEELLKRDGTIYVLVREGSRGKIDALTQRLGADEGRIVPVSGDLFKDELGVEDFSEKIDHLFHLAAVYDMEADEESFERANVQGTRNVVDFANSHDVGRFHHVSSIAVAGSYKGVFQEDMFDEEQKLPHHYHRTKYESEKMVRSGVEAKTLVYRPGMVVGHSETGVMDKVDGPYYMFTLLKKMRGALPAWVPLAGPEGGKTSIVPVDFVAKAMDHISHLSDDELPGDTFHLVDPNPMTTGEALNTFAKAAHAPQMAMRMDENLTKAIPAPVRSGRHGPADRQEDPRPGLRRPGTPRRHGGARLPLHLRLARHVARAPGHRHRSAAAGLLRRMPVGLLGAQHGPDLFRDRSLATAIKDKKVLITGASSGIGLETALRVGEAGGTVLLVSRTREKLEEVARQVEEAGGTAHVHPADLSELEDIERVAQECWTNTAASMC